MPHPDLDYPALKAAALALKEAIARFGQPATEEAASVLGFVSDALPIEDAIAGRIEAPISNQPNGERGLEGAMQGYPELNAPYATFSSQLRGIESMKQSEPIIRQIEAIRRKQAQEQ